MGFANFEVSKILQHQPAVVETFIFGLGDKFTSDKLNASRKLSHQTGYRRERTLRFLEGITPFSIKMLEAINKPPARNLINR